MKKTNIFFSTIMLMVLSINTNAQTWGSGVVNTWTTDHVGIGTSVAPLDAWLHIYGSPSGFTCPGGGPGGGVSYLNPEIWIDRQSCSGCFVGCPSPTPPANLFQISNTLNGFMGGIISTTLLDVVNSNGWLGILQPNPTVPLDVNGNALIENDLDVQAAINIGTAAYPNDAMLHINNTVTCCSGGAPDIKLSRTYGGPYWIVGAPVPNYLELGSAGTTPIDVITDKGSLGILQPNPLAPLDVNGDGIIEHNLHVQGGLIDMSEPAGTDTWRNINANSGITGLTVSAGTNGAATGGAYTTYHAAYESDPGATTIVSGDQGSGTTFWSYGGSSGPWNALMRIKPNGQVAIGMDIIYPTENLPNPDQYNLYVSKGILTQKLKVALPTDGTNWTDYVFNKDYDLMPLNRVESYVKANKHLPEVPSASEVAKDGIDVASMDARLLQKIEELTLYVIQQQKEIDQLKKQQKN